MKSTAVQKRLEPKHACSKQSAISRTHGTNGLPSNPCTKTATRSHIDAIFTADPFPEAMMILLGSGDASEFADSMQKAQGPKTPSMLSRQPLATRHHAGLIPLCLAHPAVIPSPATQLQPGAHRNRLQVLGRPCSIPWIKPPWHRAPPGSSWWSSSLEHSLLQPSWVAVLQAMSKSDPLGGSPAPAPPGRLRSRPSARHLSRESPQ